MKRHLKSGDTVVGNLVDFTVKNDGAELGCGIAMDGTQLEIEVDEGEFREVRWDFSVTPPKLYYED